MNWKEYGTIWEPARKRHFDKTWPEPIPPYINPVNDAFAELIGATDILKQYREDVNISGFRPEIKRLLEALNGPYGETIWKVYMAARCSQSFPSCTQ
jgi:hypothetical protein